MYTLLYSIIEQMGLSGPKQEQLKRIMSQRICLEEALATQWIPVRYIPSVIESLPEETKRMHPVRVYDDFYGSLSNHGCSFEPEAPAPFNLEWDGPYASVCMEGAEFVKCQKFSTSFELVAESKSMSDYGKFLSMLKNHPDAVNVSNIPPICDGWFLTIAKQVSEKALKAALNTPERMEFLNKLILYSSN